jgi:hypothetical protein
MPVVKRVAPKATEEKPSLLKKRKNPDDDLGIVLPTELSEPSHDIGDYSFLFYGSKKIGKTSLAAQFPKALAFMFEPGGTALRLLQQPCPSWAHFKQSIDKLTVPCVYKTFILDTASVLYDRCMEYACAKAGIEHPSDEGYGKGWDKVKKELTAQLSRIMLQDAGLIALAHDKVQEVETKSGRKFNKIMPNLTGQAESYFAATIDVIGYYHIDDNQRWLQIREDDFAMAGCRCEENFLTPDGQQIFKIPMGNSPQEAYANLLKAFNNQQKETYAPENVTKRVVPASVQKALTKTPAKVTTNPARKLTTITRKIK